MASQARVTDYFSTSSRSSSSKSLTKKKLLSSSTEPIEKLKIKADPECLVFDKSSQDDAKSKQLTPSKRRLSTRSNQTQSSASKKTRKESTTSKSKKASESGKKSCKTKIEFGPKVSSLDFTETKTISKPKLTEATSVKSLTEGTSKATLSPMMKAHEIKEKLKNCKNLAKLKEHLAMINGCSEKVKQFKEMKVQCLSPVKSSYSKLSPRKIFSPQKLSVSGLTLIPSPLKVAQSSVIASPSKLASKPKLTSPYLAGQIKRDNLQLPKIACSRKLFSDDDTKITDDQNNNKPNSSDGIDVPAYKRFSYMTKKTSNETDRLDEFQLSLPLKFKKLVEIFKRVDYFAWVYFKRQEICTFEKLKQSVEQASHRTFELNTLLKILSVDSKKWFRLKNEIVCGKRKLVVTPVYHESLKCLNSVSNLLEREKDFYRCLLEITRKEHIKFLAEMKLNLSEDQQIYRWHPMFKLDSVSDIVPDLSLLPKENEVKISTNNPNSILNYCIRKEKLPESTETEEKVIKKESEANEESLGKKLDKTPADKVKKGLLKGISMDLLNKIRAKEAATLAKQMMRSPEVDRQIMMLGRLSEIIRIIHSCFVGTTIKTLSFDQMVDKIADSYHCALSTNESRKHLEFLLSLDLASSWIQKIEIKNDQFIKIDRDYPLADLFRSIRNRIQKLQSS